MLLGTVANRCHTTKATNHIDVCNTATYSSGVTWAVLWAGAKYEMH